MNKILPETCPKCGFEVRGARYIQPRDMDMSSDQKHAGQLKRECGFCGYEWYENSLDNRINA